MCVCVSERESKREREKEKRVSPNTRNIGIEAAFVSFLVEFGVRSVAGQGPGEVATNRKNAACCLHY